MDRLAELCESISSHPGRLDKVRLVAEYIPTLDDSDLPRAISILCGRPPVKDSRNADLFNPAPPETAHSLSVGASVLTRACMAATGLDIGAVRSARREAGDSGEAIRGLIAGRTRNLPLALARAEEIFTALYGARSPSAKVEILRLAFLSYRPLAVKYLVKAITGNLRIGLQEKMVEEAVALASGVSAESVRQANTRLGILAEVALAARRGVLDAIEARLFHPLDFMLAKPLEKISGLGDLAAYAIEDKFDGIRSQAHVNGGRVRIFSRGMEDVTAAFPDAAAALRLVPGSAILDGELLAWRDGRALKFALLQQRLSRKRVGDDLLDRVPVVFMAYDALYRNGHLLLGSTLEQRRAELENLHTLAPRAFLLSTEHRAASSEEVERLFESARANGNEGLVFKRLGGIYEPGKRSGAWYKLKRPSGTLDVVITAAERGNGKRAAVLSDYTFAVRAENGGYLNIGKAYSGLTDLEIRELTVLLESIALGSYEKALRVRPEIVLEVAFDSIQPSTRHASGYALRFPRILRWRRDKKPADCDSIVRVREMAAAGLS